MNILALTAVNALKISKEKLDNYITIALVAALAIFIVIMVIRKAVLNEKAAKPQSFEALEIPVTESAPVLAKGSAGKIKLHDVDPKTAAMLMAIVADKTGKPLNELRFISIKEVK